VRERSPTSDREEEDERVTKKRKSVSEKGKKKGISGQWNTILVSYLCLFIISDYFYTNL